MANSVGIFDRLRNDREPIRKLYWDDKLSHREIALIYGCSKSSVDAIAKEIGITGVKTSSRMTGEKSPHYKGGKYVDKRGYVFLRVPISSSRSCQKFEHRVIAERILGRPMKQSEVVHHIDGDKSNNRNDNLLICSRGYHSWLTKKMSTLYMLEHFGRTGFAELYQQEHFRKQEATLGK